MYTPAKERYETMEYNRCGESGLMLSSVYGQGYRLDTVQGS